MPNSVSNQFDVIIVGAGPTGLLLACETGLAGLKTLVVERRAERSTLARAGGIGGEIIDVLAFRGLLQTLEAHSSGRPVPRFPFAGMHIDFTQLTDNPMQAVRLPQAEIERLLEERALQLGVELRRCCELLEIEQSPTHVTASLYTPDGETQIEAQYLVGCDGWRSPVRQLLGIEFPGTTYPEVQRTAHLDMPSGVELLDNGDLMLTSLGVRVPFGYTHTDTGTFAAAALDPHTLMLYTSDPVGCDDESDFEMEEMRASIRRVLGVDFPTGDSGRLTRFVYQARLAEHYRQGRVFLVGDAAHQFPASGVALNVGLLDAMNLGWKLAATVQGWAGAQLLDSYQQERRPAAQRTMLHTQAQVALRRGNDPAALALRELFAELCQDPQPLARLASLLAGSTRYPLPQPQDQPLAGRVLPGCRTLSPRGLPILLTSAENRHFQDLAKPWGGRLECLTHDEEHTMLVRPDATVVWTGQGDLQAVLTHWFGDPPISSQQPL